MDRASQGWDPGMGPSTGYAGSSPSLAVEQGGVAVLMPGMVRSSARMAGPL